MRFALVLAAVLALGGAVLARPASVVYGADGVRLLGDTDPHYHVLRAERWLRGTPGAPWRDPGLDWPNGAEIPWPPLFDAAIAGAARLAGAADRDAIARAAAPLPLLLGLVSLVLAAVAGRLLAGAAAGLGAAALLALLPAHVRPAVLGRLDQHVAEVLLATAIAVAFARGLAVEGRRAAGPALALGLAAVLSFWTWMGSTVALLAPCAAVAVAWLLGEGAIAARGGRVLALGCGAGAAGLAGSVAAFGPPGALTRTSVLGVGGLHVAIVAGAAAFAGLVAWRAARPPPPAPRRAAEVALALVVPAALLLGLWPGLRDGVARGLVALGAANAWYADIREFKPVFFSGMRPPGRDLEILLGMVGLLPAALLLAVPAARRRWRDEPDARPAILFLAVWTGTMLVLAAARNRFVPYLAVPGAISAAAGLRWAAQEMAARLGRPGLAGAAWVALLALTVAPAATALATATSGAERVPEPWIAAVRALRELPPAPDGRVAVAAPWQLGHLVQYYADRPVVASPFGTEAGERALPDWTTFLFATDARVAEGVLLARGVAHLILQNPSHELVGLAGYAPGPPPLVVTRHPLRGEAVDLAAGFADLVVARLYFGDGSASHAPAIEAFQLRLEGPSSNPVHPLREERLKIFALVPGADLRVSGASPGAVVTASLRATSGAGRPFQWSSARLAAPDGTARFRLPYATGANGETRAGPWLVTDAASATVEVPADAVERGRPVWLRLPAPAAAAGPGLR